MNVLIAEDDPTVNTIMMEMIQSLGHRVERAITCKETLEKAKQNRFDLIMLDIFMPDGRGYDLIPRIKEFSPTLGIVAMSGYNSRALETKIRKQGILYYMLKPFDIQCLKELLDHLYQKYDEKQRVSALQLGDDLPQNE